MSLLAYLKVSSIEDKTEVLLRERDGDSKYRKDAVSRREREATYVIGSWHPGPFDYPGSRHKTSTIAILELHVFVAAVASVSSHKDRPLDKHT